MCGAGDFVKVGLSTAAEYLAKTDGNHKMFIFCNSKSKSIHFMKELERKLDKLEKHIMY